MSRAWLRRCARERISLERRPARERDDARRRAGDTARAVLRPRLRARADAVHDADRARPELGGRAEGPARARDAVVVVGRLRVADERARAGGGRRAARDLRRDRGVPRRGAVRAGGVRVGGAVVRVRVRGRACLSHRAVLASEPRRSGAAPVGQRSRREHGDRRGALVRRGSHVGGRAGRHLGARARARRGAARCYSARTAGNSCRATSPSATARS